MNLTNCIICNTQDDLDASMTVKIDGEEIAVKLCKEHAESTTIQQIKLAYQNKQGEIEKILEQARALGLSLTATPATKIVPKLVSQVSAPVAPATPNIEGAVPIERFEAITSKRGLGVSIAGDGQVESYSGFGTAQLLDEIGQLEGEVKPVMAEGRQGIPIPIPEVSRTQLGTTTIKIVKSTDRDLQDHFRNMASNEPVRVPYAKTVVCSMCHGEGFIKRTKTETISCPRCGGGGVLS